MWATTQSGVTAKARQKEREQGVRWRGCGQGIPGREGHTYAYTLGIELTSRCAGDGGPTGNTSGLTDDYVVDNASIGPSPRSRRACTALLIICPLLLILLAPLIWITALLIVVATATVFRHAPLPCRGTDGYTYETHGNTPTSHAYRVCTYACNHAHTLTAGVGALALAGASADHSGRLGQVLQILLLCTHKHTMDGGV